MRRKIDVPIICQHESIKAPITTTRITTTPITTTRITTTPITTTPITTSSNNYTITTTEPSNTYQWTDPQENTAFETFQPTREDIIVMPNGITEMPNEIPYIYIYVG